MSENMSEIFKDHIPWLNQCNIENRPKLNLGNLQGTDGNINDILINYSNAMSSQGFVEESKYWGREAYHFNMLRLKRLNMNYDQAMSFILSMTNSNLEIMINSELGENSFPYTDNKNTYSTEGVNCYGRTAAFYAPANPKPGNYGLQDFIYDEGFEVLLEKDKLGMTPFDHWLLAGKMKAYVKGMMNVVINATEEEMKELINNKPFGYSAHDNIAAHVNKVGISNAFYYVLLKSTDETKNVYIDNYVSSVFKALQGVEKETKKNQMVDIFKNTLENLNDFKYLSKDNERFKYIILKTENKIENRLIQNYGSKYPELKAMLEKKQINESLNISQEVQEIRKSRRL